MYPLFFEASSPKSSDDLQMKPSDGPCILLRTITQLMCLRNIMNLGAKLKHPGLITTCIVHVKFTN